jgi:hypothetical protein
MIRLKRPFRPDIGSEVVDMLEDYCDAHDESNPTEVVRRALQRYIESNVARNDGVRDAYDALRRAREAPPTTRPPKDGEKASEER